MIGRALALALGLAAGGAPAQDTTATAQAGGAVLRALDTVSGALTDIEIGVGETAGYGKLAIRLEECRYPADNPASDAFAHLTILEVGRAEPLFRGWMIASSPALQALDHPRYDVWVLRCRIASGATSGG
jgi:hypothetical protein